MDHGLQPAYRPSLPGTFLGKLPATDGVGFAQQSTAMTHVQLSVTKQHLNGTVQVHQPEVVGNRRMVHPPHLGNLFVGHAKGFCEGREPLSTLHRIEFFTLNVLN